MVFVVVFVGFVFFFLSLFGGRGAPRDVFFCFFSGKCDCFCSTCLFILCDFVFIFWLSFECFFGGRGGFVIFV